MLNIGTTPHITTGNLFENFITGLYYSLRFLNKDVNVKPNFENRQIIGYICIETLHKTPAFLQDHNGGALQYDRVLLSTSHWKIGGQPDAISVL